jgi:hypothetical protein
MLLPEQLTPVGVKVSGAWGMQVAQFTGAPPAQHGGEPGD